MLSHENALYLIHHTFLPPQLPHEADDGEHSGHLLLEVTRDALLEFNHCLGLAKHHDIVDTQIAMLTRMMKIHSVHAANDVLELELQKALSGLAKSGGYVPLYINAQNADVIISKVDSSVHFEMFELSPSNSAVIGTKGRLRRSFPASAVAIDRDTFNLPDFQFVVAQTLAQMSHQAVPGLQPKVRKAGQMHDEDRDTTHPGMITEFFNGFLTANGILVEVKTIGKNTREEVFYHSARKPWRRSPLWLLVRVSLQMGFSRLSNQHDLYKTFMAFFMSRIAKLSLASSLPADLLYAMNAKLARRLMKIEDIEPNVSKEVRQIMGETHKIISDRWLAIQTSKSRHLDLSILQTLDFKTDSRMPLAGLDDYIEARKNDHNLTGRTSFHPTSRLIIYEPDVLPAPFVDRSDPNMLVQNLHGFETWVGLDLPTWTAAHMGNPDSCAQIGDVLHQYHSLAVSVYEGNPEAMSVMLLVVMELWVACDQIAMSTCSLLADYNPGISSRILPNLLLPFKDQMRRLRNVEDYISKRENALLPTNILFSSPESPNSFSARYFDQSVNLQTKLQNITKDAELARAEKVAEFTRKKAEYVRLMELYNQTDCQYYEVVVDYPYDVREERHSPSCQRCSYQSQAADIHIAIHEWPLPGNNTKAKTVLFELFVPPWFCDWRDICFYLQLDILRADYVSIEKPRSSHRLFSDPHLSKYRDFQMSETPRIGLLSQNKPHIGTHRKGKVLSTASVNDICLNNGLDYCYFDQNLKCFLSELCRNDKMPWACTYTLPTRSSTLQKFIFRPAESPNGLTSNSVIASQSQCPGHMTLNEYKALCSIPVGYHLQWLDLATQLAMPSVEFKKTEVGLVTLQCIYQAGPRSETGSLHRCSHELAGDDHFVGVLVKQLYNALERIRENWESLHTLGVLIAIARRVLSLSSCDDSQSQYLRYLADARAVAFGWTNLLKGKFQRAGPSDREEFLARAVEAALTCASSFDVERVHLSNVLQQPDYASILLQCCVIIHQGEHTISTSSEPQTVFMHFRHHRLLLDGYSELALSHNALDSAISKVWEAYKPGPSWSIVEGTRHWVISHVIRGDDEALEVHYNTLNGELLVNGAPIDRLPSEYERHGDYRPLFGHCALEVVPTNVPGMRFSSKNRYRGYLVDFGMTTTSPQDLLVCASKEHATFKLLPSRLFRSHLPDFVVDMYIHWYDCGSGNVEFRPVDDPWLVEASKRLVLVKCTKTSAWRLELPKNGSFLLGANNRTAKILADIISPLAKPLQIHISLHTAFPSLEIDIPGLRLGFSLEQRSSALRSREHRGMCVDANQSLGTLVGYHSKLLLKDEDTHERVVILLEGTVSFSKLSSAPGSIASDHPDVYATRQLSQNSYSLRVDDRLGRLVGNGGLQSRLFLVYLHALTSFCLPDPLTHKAGTEQALLILGSAGVRSFAQLTQENLDLLKLIADLTPRRGYYPTNERVMQSVEWSSQLSFLSQHPGFYKTIVSIFGQASRLSLFYPELCLRMPDMSGVDQHLMERDCIRSSTFRVSGFGAEDFSSGHDVVYDSRDRNQTSTRRESAYILSSMISHGRETFHWGLPTQGCLWPMIKRVSQVYGPDQPLDMSRFRYDALFADQDDTYVLQNWASLQREFSKKDSLSMNKFSLMMWLSTLACFKTVEKGVLEILGMFYTRRAMAHIHAPAICSFQVIHGNQVFSSELEQLLRPHLQPLQSCPGYSIPRMQHETKRSFDMRRSTHVKGERETAIQRFSSALAKQWPCEKPSIPVMTDPVVVFSYLKQRQAESTVLQRFQSCYHNLLFSRYLQVVENEVEVLDSLPLSLPGQSLPIPPSTPRPTGFMSASELFQRPSTDLPPLYDDKDPIIPEVETETSVSRLETFLTQLRQRVGKSQFERKYMEDLSCSFKALKQSIYLHEDHFPSLEFWLAYVVYNAEQVRNIHKTLNAAVTHTDSAPSFASETAGAWQVCQWPRLGPTTFLECLSREKWQHLSADWRKSIVTYGMALTSLQRAERLASACRAGRKGDIIAELENIGHRNWSPMDYPESLLLEVESGIMIRDVQEQIASEMRQPESGMNTTMQLNMGEGKSSVIVPIVAAALADSTRLVRVVVGRPQSKKMAQMLIAKLGGMLNRRVYYMPFSRSIKLNETSARIVHEICQECMIHGGVLLVQPEHILSFQLMILDRYISCQSPTGQALLQTQRFFDNYSRDIVDESDENFSVKFELIYTMGMQRQIDLSPDRWTCIHEVLDLVERIAQEIERELPSSLEINNRTESGFPRIRILRSEAEPVLVDRVGRHICQSGLVGFPIVRQPATVRDAVFTYITKADLSEEEIDSVEQGPFWTDIMKEKLFLLRGLLAGGILVFSFARKRWRVSYGLDLTRNPPTRLAVPYRAKDLPTARSEFSHPDVVILLTSLSYYYGGLKDKELFIAFSHLLESDQKDIEYREWVRYAPKLSTAFQQLQGVNLKDRPACTSQLFPALRHVKTVVDYFLSNIVFPKEMREFPHKLSASGWDLGKVKTQPTTGFSGTCDSKTLLPLHVTHLDLPEQIHTNALVLRYLLQDENSVMYLPSTSNGQVSDAEQLLSAVMDLKPSPRVIVDVGAQVLELDNLGVARAWLHKYDDSKDSKVQAVIFFNDQDELSVLDRKGKVEILQTSSYAYQLDLCLVFLDEAHTRGTDLKLPPHYRAAVTLGPNLTKDRLVQACMRMRKLGKGQSVVFCVTDEIRRRIEDFTQQARDADISVSDVLSWAISESFIDIRRSMPLWAVQGKRFVDHSHLWEDIRTERRLMTDDFAGRFMEEEAQSLETRYKPKPPGSVIDISGLEINQHPDLDAIAERCHLFEDLQFSGSALQEEQERELSPEIEQERQVQRPDAATPAVHFLHPDVRRFVEKGTVIDNSDAYIPAFISLSDISAAATYDVTQLSGDRHLLVTKDFARTVEKVGKSYKSDAFLRSVQWILTFTPPDTKTIEWAMVVSPYEAQELFPRLIQRSAVVLHVYKPCWNAGFPPLDELGFLTIPTNAMPRTLPQTLKAQLNLFAGQLYFSAPKDYTTACEFLGLATEKARSDWKVSPDGFIVEDESGTSGAKSGLRESPVALIRALTNMRMGSSGLIKTHLGKVLDGALLTGLDFEG